MIIIVWSYLIDKIEVTDLLERLRILVTYVFIFIILFIFHFIWPL